MPGGTLRHTLPAPPRCAQATELLKTESYRRGDLRQAMADAYYALDLLLDSEEGKQELRMLVGAPSKRCARQRPQRRRLGLGVVPGRAGCLGLKNVRTGGAQLRCM